MLHRDALSRSTKTYAWLRSQYISDKQKYHRIGYLLCLRANETRTRLAADKSVQAPRVDQLKIWTPHQRRGYIPAPRSWRSSAPATVIHVFAVNAGRLIGFFILHSLILLFTFSLSYSSFLFHISKSVNFHSRAPPDSAK